MSGTFGFSTPWVLLLLIAVPALALWFLSEQRRYLRDALAFSQVDLVRNLKHVKHQVLQQRVLPVLLLLALAFGVIGLAQPVWKTRVMTQNTYLMLVMDISISMEATDLVPNRLQAAKKAAIEFTRDLPDEVRLGLAFFAGNTYLVTPPVADHRLVTAYLKSLEMEDLRPGTAIGDALIAAVESLEGTINQHALEKEGAQPSKRVARQPQGAIILLTDGETNLGISPLVATDEAVSKGVTVFPIGIGEESGAFVRGGVFTRLDEPTLKLIAQQTGGTYYRARSVRDFREIYRKIGRKTLGYEEKTLNLMPWCLGLSLAMMLGGFIWAVRHRRF